MNKRLRLALCGVALILAGYVTGNPALLTSGITSAVQAAQE